MPTYRVIYEIPHPNDPPDRYTTEVEAKNRREAQKLVRKQVWRIGPPVDYNPNMIRIILVTEIEQRVESEEDKDI